MSQSTPSSREADRPASRVSAMVAEPRHGSPCLEVRDLSIGFGGIKALHEVSFDVAPSEICGLIGPNGAGKTTLFNCISRLYQPSSGTITYRAGDSGPAVSLLEVPAHKIASIGIARTFQNLALVPSLSVLENVMIGLHPRTKAGFGACGLKVGMATAEEKQIKNRAASILGRLGMGGLMNSPAAGLPFGTLKRLELARAVASSPQLLLLDEPAAGLTHAEVDELGDTIVELAKEENLTVLLVEHHMAMVMKLSDHVVVLEGGEKLTEGPPSQVRSDPAVIAAYLGTDSSVATAPPLDGEGIK